MCVTLAAAGCFCSCCSHTRCWLLVVLLFHSTEPPHLPPHLRKIILNQPSPSAAPKPAAETGAASPATGSGGGGGGSAAPSGSTGSTFSQEDVTELAQVCPHFCLALLRRRGSHHRAPLLFVLQANHVTLNHLYCTAMKHGLMVLGTTFRYKQKCVTTVYYSVASQNTS